MIMIKNFSNIQKLWAGLIAVLVVSFGVLIYFGVDIYRQAPPIPAQVLSEQGEVLFTQEDVQDGQNVWQSMGGQTVGSVWGHGAYIAPDWTADYLHREYLFLIDYLSEQGFEKNSLQDSAKNTLRKNTFDKQTQNILFSEARATAYKKLTQYYSGLFMNDTAFTTLRKSYAIAENSIKDVEKMRKMVAFFAWASWASVTEKTPNGVSYTNNFPYDENIGNIPSAQLHIWSGFSVLLLLLGVALLAFWQSTQAEPQIDFPKQDPLRHVSVTPSMRATLKYFWIVSLLILLQMLAGVITAHYGVEGDGFFGLPIAEFLPQSLSRSLHVQWAIFWIATSWLATGLYIAPLVSGQEPKYQKMGVHVLFVALLIVVFGSAVGLYLGIMQKLGFTTNFFFGHQGYEYLELGRFWQILLLIGLFLWLFLVLRALLPALKVKENPSRPLLFLFVIASIAIALFYGAGLMYGQRTHLAIAEYWRWWVVHLWVEGFFEVFATVVSAFLFVRLGLLNAKHANASVLFATIIFLFGGIIGTFHHLYFSGTPISILALGATFSALEVVPLVLIGAEAFHNYTLSKSSAWIAAYKYPIYCFIAVCFWNFLGAGIFGFAINPPIALYYMQGLNTTAVHGHAALFGVYGILGIGLMLFVLRGLYPDRHWNEKLLTLAFWGMNIGLALMVIVSVLPIGILQVIACMEHGYWYARSAEFMQQNHIQVLRWLRVFGDIILAFGEVCLVIFVIGLKTGWSLKEKR
jgi:nitric oxide reductase subunit B